MENHFLSGYGQWGQGDPASDAQAQAYYSTQYPMSQPLMNDPTQPPVMGAKKKKKATVVKGPFTLNPAISIKNQLQEYAQHHGLPFPFYVTRPKDAGSPSSFWISTINFNGTEYTSDIPSAGKKQAEARAAEVCLIGLGLVASPSKPAASALAPNAAAPKGETKPASRGKADLHEYLAVRKLPPAVYATKEASGGVKGFVATVEAAGDTWENVDVLPNKKAAENRVAEIALEVLKLRPEPEKKPAVELPDGNFVLTLNVSDSKFKASVHEYCSRRQLPKPIYEVEVQEGPKFKGYTATCEVNGCVFHSEEGKFFASKKNAEQAAASAAWDTMKDESVSQDAAEKTIQAIPYKNILQEHLGRRDLEQPTFTHEKVTGSGFLAICEFEDKSYKSTTPYFNKKTAESEAAKVALEGLGIVNLNKVVERRILKAKRLNRTDFNWRDTLIKFYETKGKKLPEIVVEPRNGRYFACVMIEGGGMFHSDITGFQEEASAVQSAARKACTNLSVPLHIPLPGTQPNAQAEEPAIPAIDVIMDDATGQDVHVPTPGLKRRLEEWAESRLAERGIKKARSEEAWAVPKHLLQSLVVVEIWPEKRNVVIVGNESFSCPMVCLNDETKCEIVVDGKTVALQPGMVLENVEAVFKYIHYCGGITLLANQCARVSQATASTSPVITGAGVVVITREEDVVKVLLKRYKTSMAFIPAAQELSFALRRAGFFWTWDKKKLVINKKSSPNPVDSKKVVEKIHLWTNEEVDAVRKMTPESMKALFSVTKWKWLDNWDAVLTCKTQTELKELLLKSREERIAAGNQNSAANEENGGEEESQGMEDGDDQGLASSEEKQNGDKPSNGLAAPVAEVQDDKPEVEDDAPLRTKFGFDEVARLAEAEFQRRQSLQDGSLDELSLRPWGFPKGGFRHQALSTGIYLETVAECARRELKEECGVALKLPEVEKAEKIVVLRTDADNLNPHKGDANLYFLHEVDPSVTETAGKPIQDIMDITRNPYHQKVKTKQMKGNFRRQFPNHAVNYARQPYLLRQKEVHEEFAWYPLEEAAVLTPICKYIMTTDGFRTFAKLPPIVKEEIKPVPVANTDSPMRPGGRRGRR